MYIYLNNVNLTRYKIMANKYNNVPQTERRDYHSQPKKNEWMSRNQASNNFFPPELTNSSGLNTYFDDEGLTDITQTISAVSKPVVNFGKQKNKGFNNFNPSSSIPNFTMKPRSGSRNKKK